MEGYYGGGEVKEDSLVREYKIHPSELRCQSVLYNKINIQINLFGRG